MAKQRPCPHCGADPKVRKHPDFGRQVFCLDDHEHESEWNTRPEEDRYRAILKDVAVLAMRWANVTGRYAKDFTPHGNALLKVFKTHGIDPEAP